nr:MAG TPA: homing endonuclease [Caudoviricetes sp.]
MEFKPIKGYEGIYEACSDGTIWTCEGKTTYSNWHGKIRKRTWKRRELKPQIQKRIRSSHSDKRVKLWKDGEMKTHLVSRLVASAFIPNPENKDFVNHKNGNPLDNSKENLEWTTRSENQKHAFDTGLMSTNKRVTLKDLSNDTEYHFNSMSKASEFLGKNNGYVSEKIKKGAKIKGYELTVL